MPRKHSPPAELPVESALPGHANFEAEAEPKPKSPLETILERLERSWVDPLENTPTGKHRILTFDLAKQIVTLVCRGVLPARACKSAGISDETLRRYVQRADDGDQPYRAFMTALNEATTVLESALLEGLTNSNDWKAKAWLLERLHPDQYAAPAPRENYTSARPQFLAAVGPAKALPALPPLEEYKPPTEKHG